MDCSLLSFYMRFSIVAIGTELTTGDLVDSNSAWISERLFELGYTPSLHISVPDSDESIISALNFAAGQSDLLFVTGGLGPTEDDRTRSCIASWTSRPLQLDLAADERVRNKITKRGLSLTAGHRFQCTFPKGSALMTNAVGTADGFYLDSLQNLMRLYVLPGPPRELKAIWADHIDAWVTSHRPQESDQQSIKRFFFVSVAESEMADLIEPLFKQSPLTVGFRASFPLLEMKITGTQQQLRNEAALLEQTQQLTQSYVQIGNPKDCLIQLADAFWTLDDFMLIDPITNGALQEAMSSCFNSLSNQGKPYVIANFGQSSTFQLTNVLELKELTPLDVQVNFSNQGKLSTTQISLTQFASMTSERRSLHIKYLTLFFLQKCLCGEL